jgi:hypothetical protein
MTISDSVLSPDIFSSLSVRDAYVPYFAVWMAMTAWYPVGRNIFAEDWDLAIVLDGCRYDALCAVQGEYEFINDVQKALSLGSSSKEWMVNTFQPQYEDEAAETLYVTGNAWADIVLADEVSFDSWTVTKGSVGDSSSLLHRLAYRETLTEDDFADVYYQPLGDIGGIEGFSAEELTHYGIEAGRNHNSDRVLLHYMQPHAPFLHRVSEGHKPNDFDNNPFEKLRNGYDGEHVWEAYMDNLRYVLDHVETLMENYEGDVLITADHGEMFGPGPLAGHGEGILHPKLKVVPWVRTSGVDEETIQVQYNLSNSMSDTVGERLSALGYL